MDREKALKLLRGGPDGVKEWNEWRITSEEIPDLRGSDLSGVDLRGADVSGARLRGAQLHVARLCGTQLISCDLRGSDLRRADLFKSCLSHADLRGADLSGANLESASVGWTSICNVNLSVAKNLESVRHTGPSSIGMDTLVRSRGSIPREFLKGCGLAPWQIEVAKIHDPSLDPAEIAEIATKMCEARSSGPLHIGGVFISYSRSDEKFVDRIREHLIKKEASVWLDRHDMVAGDIQKQVSRAVRLQDVVLLVLSEAALKSDWVAHELRAARKKEKEAKRDVLCPVSLDDSWNKRLDDDVDWSHLKKKNILDFSKWETDEFEPQFEKLVKGLKLNY